MDMHLAMTIQAIYENGVFRPLEKVALKEGERVSLHIDYTASAGSASPTMRQVLQEAGHLSELSPYLRSRVTCEVSLEEVRQALDGVGGKTLSEIILEQRGPRP